jgi:uncharacterized protein (TIGR03435 family)
MKYGVERSVHILAGKKGTEAGCLLILGACLAFAQAPAFEVASIKPSNPAASVAIHRSGYHVATTGTSLLSLITWAYDIQSDRLYGKPKWLDSVRYDVVANAPEGKLPDRRPGEPGALQQMMQTLLAERFKLALHREEKQLPMYALVVSKNGPKIQLTPAPAVMGQNPFSMPGRGRLVGTKVSAEMLAKVLSGQLDRSVQDETGLKGVFDFKLEWTPDSPAAGPGGEPASPDVRTGPSLFTAVQEQLGLKLEARKGKVEAFVIDHIESAPTQN